MNCVQLGFFESIMKHHFFETLADSVVVGKPRIYLEKDESKTEREGGPKKRLFGVQWGW